jgi:hypothetical protein
MFISCPAQKATCIGFSKASFYGDISYVGLPHLQGSIVKVITNFGVLMQLAKALGDAKKSGDADAIAEAQREHDDYRDLCLRADEVTLGVPYSAL